MKGGSITNVQMGIDMAGSGTLTVEDGTRIEFKGTHGVKVGGSVTSATLTGVMIRGDGKGMGVYAGAGNLTVKGGSITNVLTGIDMSGSGTLTVSGTEIQFKNGHGVRVGEKVTSATLTNVQIKGTDGKGMGVHAEGGNLTVKGGSITNVLTGIDMSGSGTLKVEDGTKIEFKGTHGIGVWGDVTVSLTGTKIMGEGNGSDGSSTGIGVIMAGKTMTMDKVDISGVAMGVYAGSGKLVIREGTTINFAKTYGVKVGASVTSTELTRVTIVGEGKGTGVYAGGKTMMITGGSITNVQMGIDMAGSGTLKVEDGTRISFKGTHGIGVWGGTATAELTEVTIKGEGKDKGIGVIMAGSSGTMKDVRISGVGMGVEVKAGNLTITGGEIKEVQTGIAMMGDGKLTVEDNTTISFTRGYGVKVGGMVTSAQLTKVTITGTDGKGKGVYAKGGTVMVSGGWIRGVQTGIDMSGSGTLTVKDGTVITVTENGYGVGVWGGTATAELTEVTIKGEGEGKGTGVYAEGGNLTVKGGWIREVEKGIVMIGDGMLMVKDNTTIHFTRGYGVYVGGGATSTELKDVQIKGEKSGYGVYAGGKEG
ncbi:right-handed parallel beta-helix repeat-containing protein [Bartonella sp. WD16.2]|uniref:right-handed parallel beta-helix repeat-containing protein n=1 Tax=Bartonella sp. WD16.2 TaxID=1933904 RepID=UPI0009994C03|nr:right-handed parallel beta-helix repeat-containing protein [Bartonella sp. WD16.2]AQX20171.1 Right handed beta helix region [Bartonella sp. WD16.2]